MKLQYVNYVIFIFITIPIFCSGQNKLKSSSIDDFDLLIQKMENPTENEIFSLSNNELNHLITTLKKEKTLIYTFGWWCEPCIEKLPEILNLKNKYKDKIDLILLTAEKEDSKYLYLTNWYFENKFDVHFPTFNLSIDLKGSRLKRYETFINRIVPGHTNYGYSLIIVIDNLSGSVLYASTYKETTENIFLKIEHLLN